MTKETVLTFFQKYKFFFLLLFLFIFCLFGILMYYFVNSEAKNEEVVLVKEQMAEKNEKEETKMLAVDVKGAIASPGLYFLMENERVKDALDKAGGLLETAHTDYINLGKKLKDEMVIIIYTKEEIQGMIEGNNQIKIVDNECICPVKQNDSCIEESQKECNLESSKDAENGIINLNTATKQELETLSGIGSSKAEAIIKYREKTPFTKIEDILNVKGIGEGLFAKIKDRITV